jgi:hypothetical protein
MRHRREGGGVPSTALLRKRGLYRRPALSHAPSSFPFLFLPLPLASSSHRSTAARAEHNLQHCTLGKQNKDSRETSGRQRHSRTFTVGFRRSRDFVRLDRRRDEETAGIEEKKRERKKGREGSGGRDTSGGSMRVIPHTYTPLRRLERSHVLKLHKIHCILSYNETAKNINFHKCTIIIKR